MAFLSSPALAISLAITLGVIGIWCRRTALRGIPGPLLAKWTDGWYMWQIYQGKFEHKNLELHAKHGPIVQYGVNRYSICDPSSLNIIYGPGSQFPKSTWYSSWAKPGSWSIFVDQDIKRHALGRRLFQATYSMSSLVHYEPFVDQGAEVFEQRLREMAERNDTVDMRHWFQCYAFDIIGSITYGKRFGFLDQGVDIESLMSVLDGHVKYASLAGLVPSLHPFLNALKDWWAGKKGSGRQYLLSFTLQQMKEHQDDAANVDDAEEHDGPLAFVLKFMAKHAGDPAKFTQAHIVAYCVSNIVAGSDTTGISLSATLYYLLRTPRCLESLRSEIDTCRSKGQLSDQPTFKETQQMPYLQAVIKEALRIHPATGLPLERVVPPGDAEIAGRRFPEGSIVGVNPWVEHRSPSIFGDDADAFRPERWLVDDAEALSLMNRQFIPFGLGARNCIGRHISMLEMSKLIPRIIRDFDFELEENRPWSTQNLWFVKPVDFRVRIKARQKE